MVSKKSMVCLTVAAALVLYLGQNLPSFTGGKNNTVYRTSVGQNLKQKAYDNIPRHVRAAGDWFPNTKNKVVSGIEKAVTKWDETTIACSNGSSPLTCIGDAKTPIQEKVSYWGRGIAENVEKDAKGLWQKVTGLYGR